MEPEIIISHIANSSLAGHEQRFQKPKITVGRDGGNDIEFDADEDLVVSHNHAEIYVEDGILHVRDLDSRNGTYVNQRRVTAPSVLQPEDTLEFGFTGPSAKVRLGVPGAEPDSGVRETLLHRLMSRGPRGGEARPAPPRRPAPRPVERPEAPAIEALPASPMTAGTPQAGRVPAWMGTAMLILIAAALGITGAVGYIRYAHSGDEEGQGSYAPGGVNALAGEPLAEAVAALGRLEPEDGIYPVSGTAGQTLKRLLVVEGQSVKRDDPLAHLSSFESMQAEYDAARASLSEATSQSQSTKEYAAALVAEARAAVQQTGRPLDLEIAALEADIELLQAHYDLAVDDRKQLEKQTQGQNAAQLSRQKMVEQGAERELTAARRKLEQLRESVPLRRAQAEAQLQSAIANQARLEQSILLETARENVKRAQAHFEQAIIRAPRDGTVLKILTREGEALGGQPILELADTRRMRVVAEVYETDVRHVAKGQRATVSSAALPEELHGKVDKVLWTIERNSLRNLNPVAPEDLRVVKVNIHLDDGEVTRHHALLERLINLQVDVRILLQ